MHWGLNIGPYSRFRSVDHSQRDSLRHRRGGECVAWQRQYLARTLREIVCRIPRSQARERPLPHCTAAIHLSLLALKVGPGEEVIVPDCTWIASAAPITYVGATTVFADIEPQSWCLGAGSFELCITPQTKAIIPVDLYGNMPDFGRHP